MYASTAFFGINGRIYTLNKNQPWAKAIFILLNKIVAVGTTDEIKKFIQPQTEVIDLNGKLVLPGFNDAHLHFFDGAFFLQSIDLRDARDEQDFANRIKNFTASIPCGTWITGGNWDHKNWESKKRPTRDLIDPVTRKHPVFVSRLDLHIGLANSLALTLAGIDKHAPNPPGGEIVKNPKTGELTGILIDKACDLVFRIIPALSLTQKKKIIKQGLAHAAQYGITSFQDNSNKSDLLVYQNLLRKGELTSRINSWFEIEEMDNFTNLGLQANFGNDMLRVGTMKIYADGSMGAGSALFYEPYSDEPTRCGLALNTEEQLKNKIGKADAAGLQIAIHAIGDKANNLVLNALEKAYLENGNRKRRHRIEHAQVVTPDDLVRYRSLGVIASIQPSHLIDDMTWAEKRIGFERCKNAYRINSFFIHEIPIAFGTDWPVESLNPLLGIYAATTRKSIKGEPKGGWFPDEKISVKQAIEAYTLGSAYAEFAEHKKGSIEAGKLADIVVLSKNLLEIPASEILNTKVICTIVDGKIVYSKYLNC